MEILQVGGGTIAGREEPNIYVFTCFHAQSALYVLHECVCIQ